MIVLRVDMVFTASFEHAAPLTRHYEYGRGETM
jgi:hypothetical protein